MHGELLELTKRRMRATGNSDPQFTAHFSTFFLTAALLRSYDLRIVGMTVPSSA